MSHQIQRGLQLVLVREPVKLLTVMHQTGEQPFIQTLFLVTCLTDIIQLIGRTVAASHVVLALAVFFTFLGSFFLEFSVTVSMI